MPDTPAALSDWGAFYWPLLVYGTALLLGLLRRRWGPALPPGRSWALAGLIGLGLPLMLQAVSRNDSIHALPTAAVAGLVLVALGGEGWVASRRPALRGLLGVALGIGLLGVVGRPLAQRLAAPGGLLRLDCAAAQRLHRGRSRPTASGCLYPTTHGAGGQIYVGAPRHDRLVLSEVMFYFLADLPAATTYPLLDPGVTTTAPVQTAMIHTLEQPPVRYLVLWAGGFWWEPNESSRSSGVRLLDRFIRAHYRRVAQFDDYSVWQRQPAPDRRAAP